MTTPAKSKGGRPIRFSPENQKRFLDCLSRGMPIILACRAIRCSQQTFYSYRNSHPEFAAEVELALADFANKHLQTIQQASVSGEWRASAWLLEHCLPEFFAKTRIAL